MSKGVNRYKQKDHEKDKFNILQFDHLEWYVGDAITALQIFKYGLGMNLIGESKHETGNHIYCSYVLQTSDVKWILTSPYLPDKKHPSISMPNPTFDEKHVSQFLTKHGCGVGVIGIKVEDAASAYTIATENGAQGVVEPIELQGDNGNVVISEIQIYGDTRIRYIQYKGFQGPFLPGYRAITDPKPLDYNIMRMDHVVGNVWKMDDVIAFLKRIMGLHTFSKFTKEEIETEYTALNSEVLSNDHENVLLPINEHAPKKKTKPNFGISKCL